MSVAELTEEIAGLHFNSLNKNGNRLEIDMPYNLPVIEADHDRLLQVLLNLLSNASRHTKDGVIRISARAENNYITLSVSDTGEGIPEEMRGRLFERYLGVDIGRAHGTGLGLYICRQIAEAHGGTIWIESKTGEGTAVYFTLPCQTEGSHE
jgi:signal transduction histidine kinase